MNRDKILKLLTVVRRSCDMIEEELNSTNHVEPAIVALPKVAEEIKFDRSTYVKEILSNPNWPDAVAPIAVASVSDEGQQNRAVSVMDSMMRGDLAGKSFLDFGCGDGWIAKEALNRKASVAAGYDIDPKPTWKKLSGVNFTDRFEELRPQSYDVIMLYDVLDHAKEPEEVMGQVETLLAKGGVVYVRCHPWTSKHATHIFKQGLNKAFLHLFLTWQEIYEALGGNEPMYTRIEKNPIEAYHWWFHNFKIVEERQLTEPVHPFFLKSENKSIIQREQQLKPEDMDVFCNNMKIMFVDYVLTKK